MTPKQILDSLSEVFLQDERILSEQERSLLTSLLEHAWSAAGENPQTQEAVRKALASAVGETIAQRAFAIMGSSMVERILSGTPFAQAEAGEVYGAKKAATKAPRANPISPTSPGQPQPPGSPRRDAPSIPGSPSSPGQPQPPGSPLRDAPGIPGIPSSPGQPQPPGSPLRDAPAKPGTPSSPGQPQPPGSLVRQSDETSATALLERPKHLPARCLVLDEFLAPQDLEELTRFTLEKERQFVTSEVISPASERGVVDYDHRRSRVLMDLGPFERLMLERIKPVLPRVLEELGMKEFTIAGVEAQITASNDGDFFHMHSDSGEERAASRYLTFVYFFHREPRQFEGGELRIHDARLEGDVYASEGSCQLIVPQQNQIVFFPCELMHEITPVKCPSRAFADSRFTLNGWLRR